MNTNSNVVVCSNVYVRKENLYPTEDVEYNKRIRGRDALKVMLQAKCGYEVRIDEVNQFLFLTEQQKSEYKSLRCPICKRLDFGYIIDGAGNIKWRMLKECFCNMIERHH